MRMRVRAIAIFSSLFADKQNQQEKKVVVYRRGGAVFFSALLSFFVVARCFQMRRRAPWIHQPFPNDKPQYDVLLT